MVLNPGVKLWTLYFRCRGSGSLTTSFASSEGEHVGGLKNKKQMKNLIFMFLLVCTIQVQANWIIFSQRFTADASVIVYNGRVYMLTSHDTDPCAPIMGGYNLISSDDLLNWTDHGIIIHPSDIPYINSQFWAPEFVHHNGKFYIYFCEPMVGTGVVESDTPFGPWEDKRGSLMANGHVVDIGVMIDEDGTPWCTFPSGDMRKLKQNMYEFEKESGYAAMKDSYEAPHLGYFNGKYYYMYQTFRDEDMWATEPMQGLWFHRYTFLETPAGPIIEPGGPFGRFMGFTPGGNSQPFVFNYQGNWYNVYHGLVLADQTDQCGFHRNVGLDRIYFNPDGTFVPQTVTQEGLKQVKYLNPFIRQEAETIGRESGIEVYKTNDDGVYNEQKVGSINHNDWIKVFGVDFGEGATTVETRVASQNSNGQIEIRLDSLNGTLVGTINIPATGGDESFQTISTAVSGATGIHDLFFVFKTGGFYFNWWKFSGSEVSGAIPPPVIKAISIKSVSQNKNVSASSTALNPISSTVAADQQYYLYDNENGTYSLFSIGQNKYITISGDKLVAAGDTPQQAEQFILVLAPDLTYCLWSQTAQSYVIYSSTQNALITGIAEPWKDPNKNTSRFIIDYLNISVPVCNIPQSAFSSNKLPGTIEAENYDGGCPGEAFHDADIINLNGFYRHDGPDIDTINTGGYAITNTVTGEWLEYTLLINSAGIFDVELVVKADHDNNKIKFIYNGIDTADVISFDKTAGAWSRVNTTATLDSGIHVMQLLIIEGNMSIDKMNFTQTKVCKPSVIMFTPIADPLSSAEPFKIMASSDPVWLLNYSILSGPATVSQDTITLTGWKGTVKYRVSLDGDINVCPSRIRDSFNIIHDCTPQVITIDTIPDKIATDSPFTINAISDKGLPVSLSISGPATLTGNTVTLEGIVGKVSITATQAGSESTCEAVKVMRKFNVLLPNHQCTDAAGYITLEKWNDISGSAVSDIPVNTAPHETDTLNSMNVGSFNQDDFGVRLRGYICAPYTGDYIFYIAGDDQVELWLSSDTDTYNKVKIAYHNGWTGQYEYDKFNTQKSDSITLVGGHSYYIEALMKEGFGNDHLTVKWVTPFGMDAIIGSEFLSPICLIQSITLPANATSLGDNKFIFNITSSSGLTPIIKVTGNNIEMHGDTLVLLSNRVNVTLEASLSGDSIYCEAASVSKKYIVITTSTEDIRNNKEMKIFPNPANNVLFVDGADIHIKRLIIEDITGKTIYQSNEKRQGLFQIDISSFAKGTFIIRINYGEQEIQKLFSKN